jgi:uncharacterized protein (TIGR02996 family)
MSVYFVYRCPYLGPTEKYVKRFDDATLVDWFRRRWRPLADPTAAHKYAETVLGREIPSFGNVFAAIAERKLRRPTSIEEVIAAVTAVEHNQLRSEEHCLQMVAEGNDPAADDTTMAYYFFDDDFLRRYGPEMAAYLLHEDWQLPDGHGVGGWKPDQPVALWEFVKLSGAGPGRIYTSLLEAYAGEDLESLEEDDAYRLDGLRIPDLCSAVMRSRPKDVGDYYLPQLRQALRSADLVEAPDEKPFVQAIQECPDDELNWLAYSDWLEERGQRRPAYRLLEAALRQLPAANSSDSAGNLVHVGDHIVQFAKDQRDGSYSHMFLFDDVWGSAQPALANALLRYATRWDVLSTGNEQLG